MSLDVFLYMLAPQDFNPNIEIMMTGYDLTRPSLFLANVLRDISMGGGYIFLWSLFIAAYIIRNGEAKTKHPTIWKFRGLVRLGSISFGLAGLR